MKQTASHQTTYPLGHSDEELERLSRQAQVFEPFTRQLFQQAGITAGKRVLDVGSGSGDVTGLAADLVGPSGEVIGEGTSKRHRERKISRRRPDRIAV